MPVPNGKSKFVEIRYDSKYPALRSDFRGQTFDHVFGTNTSLLEIFIIHKKIMGPCWMTVSNPTLVQDFSYTWCDFELIVNNSKKDITISTDDKNKESPKMTVLSFALKTY